MLKKALIQSLSGQKTILLESYVSDAYMKREYYLELEEEGEKRAANCFNGSRC